jgi:fatty acid desaturase
MENQVTESKKKTPNSQKKKKKKTNQRNLVAVFSRIDIFLDAFKCRECVINTIAFVWQWQFIIIVIVVVVVVAFFLALLHFCRHITIIV